MFTERVLIDLRSGLGGLSASLRATVHGADGVPTGPESSGGFVELAAGSASYQWTGSFADGFVGCVRFRLDGSPSVRIGAAAIRPPLADALAIPAIGGAPAWRWGRALRVLLGSAAGTVQVDEDGIVSVFEAGGPAALIAATVGDDGSRDVASVAGGGD